MAVGPERKNPERDFLYAAFVGAGSTQARAYLIIVRGLFVFLITANSTRLEFAGPQ
jgi:hypothetical protein